MQLFALMLIERVCKYPLFNFKISEDKWKEALDIWTDSLKGKRTIISSIANLKLVVNDKSRLELIII